MDTQITKTRELANFHYISLTDQGCVRENNEDYLGYATVAAVCPAAKKPLKRWSIP